MNNDNEFVIYFVATRPYIVKALGDNIYYTLQDAQEIADFWQPLAPYKVFRAIVTKIEAAQEATR